MNQLIEKFYAWLNQKGYKRSKDYYFDTMLQEAQNEEALREREVWDAKTGEFIGYRK